MKQLKPKRRKKFRGPIKWLSSKITLWKLNRAIAKAKEAGDIDDNGITGRGNYLPGIGLLSMNYSADGKIFIRDKTGEGWFRGTAEEAAKRGLRVIRCNYCDKPAVTLDHSYPYQTETTACQDHLKEYDKRCGRV